MWGDAIIIDRVLPAVSEDTLRTKEADKIVLTWEQRRWVRGRFVTHKGRKIGLALPTGTTLLPDSILWVGPDWYLSVEAASEAVLEIFPVDCQEAVRIAFEVGNRHFPLAVHENNLLVPDEKSMVRLMERLGVRWERRQTVFNPIANAQSHEHA
jgi:urease accessory protein